jgi:preprotein translocase subunit SecY
LVLVRLGLYVPVPGIDINIFDQEQALNPMFGFARTLVGNSFFGIGSLGILPYINASIIIQLLTPVFPQLEKLQKEDGEIGRQQISKYTRYLTFIWAVILSSSFAFFFIKPIIFDWSFRIAINIVLSLTVGSLLSMWFAELITEEGLGNGSSMIIFINIVGGLPNASKKLINDFLLSDSLVSILLDISKGLVIYLFIVLVVIFFQDSYKRINIISAKQLNAGESIGSDLTKLKSIKSSFIPLKLNQGGIMPLVFSSTISVVLVYPIQILFSNLAFTNSQIGLNFITFYSFAINLVLVVFFSCFYVSLVLKPKEIAKNLNKMAYTLPGIKQGNETTKYLEKVINRLAFVGGLFLAFLAFFPVLITNLFQLNLFKNLTSLLILIGVITDTTSQIRGYLLSVRYEGFKKT